MILKTGTIITCPNCNIEIATVAVDISSKELLSTEQFNFKERQYKAGDKMDCFKCGGAFFKQGSFHTKDGWYPELKPESPWKVFSEEMHSFESIHNSKIGQYITKIWNGFENTLNLEGAKNELKDIISEDCSSGYGISDNGFKRLDERNKTLNDIAAFRMMYISYSQYPVYAITDLYNDFEYIFEIIKTKRRLPAIDIPFDKIFQLVELVKELEAIEKKKGIFIFKDLVENDFTTKYNKVIMAVQCGDYKDLFDEIRGKLLTAINNYYYYIKEAQDPSRNNSTYCIANTLHSLMTRIYMTMFIFEYYSQYLLTQKEEDYNEFMEKNL